MFKAATLDFISTKPEIAKQVVRGLEKEVIRLQAALAKTQGYDGQTGLLEEIEELLLENQRENDLLKKKMFNRSSEKRETKDSEGPDGSGKTNSAETEPKRTKPQQSGRGEVGKNLPMFPEEHTLPPGSTCDCVQQNALKKVKKTVVSHIVDYVPAKLIKRKIIRQVYRAKGCGCRLTAPGPTTLIDGGQYGIDMAVEIVVRKFQDQLPWERQVKAFKRDGLALSATTMWNQTRHVADLMEPVVEGIRKDIEAGYCRHADETRWRVIEGVNQKTQYAWLFRNDHHAYFTIEDSRSGKIPLRVMKGAVGALVADDYAGYNSLVVENGLQRVQCWSHTRRKFLDIEAHYTSVGAFLDLVGDLYHQDRCFRTEGKPAAERRAMCGPVIEAIDVWRKNQSCLPKSGLGKALDYLDDNWAGLTAFLDDPILPLDNNPAEHALRQLVLGRKNFLFNRTMEGARVSAILYSIVVSCALSEVDPKAYLRETILRIRNCRGFQLPYEFANDHEAIDLI